MLSAKGLEEPAQRLPAGVVSYKRTAEFTEDTIPAGLLKAHSTKEGIWGLIQVIRGRLLYRVVDKRRVNHEMDLSSNVPGVVEPGILHELQAAGPVRFFVEFYC